MENEEDIENATVNSVSETFTEDILENNLLKKYNLVMNLKHNLLICKTCKYVIEEGTIVNHVSRNHRNIVDSKILKKEEESIFLEDLNLIAPMINSNLNVEEDCEFIQGLIDFEGYQCSDCKYICLADTNIKKHIKNKHNNNEENILENRTNQNQKIKNYEKCNVQTLFLQPDKRRYFRVNKISRLPNQIETIDRECIEIIFARNNSNNRGDQLRTGHQFVSSFHTEANWNYVFDKFNNEEIDNIVGMQVDKKLEESMGKIFDQGEKFSKVVNHHFNQLIDNPLSK